MRIRARFDPVFLDTDFAATGVKRIALIPR